MLNFKKNGIFTRQAPREDTPPEQEPQGGILAVWGSPGSGLLCSGDTNRVTVEGSSFSSPASVSVCAPVLAS